MLNSTLDQNLLAAQTKAWQLLAEIERRQFLVVGATEKQITEKIYDLALELFGTKKHWHKRIVRTGVNSALSFHANPPDCELKKDDLVYLDLGPVFDEFEGDIGKTYLLGNDPEKQQLLDDLDSIWQQTKSYYLSRPSMTGAALWWQVQKLTNETKWKYGSAIAGHIISEFSHKQKYGDSPTHRINELNQSPMNAPHPDGKPRHWILELHIVEPQLKYGAFFEDLLTL
jgi:hypothetical protein